MVKQAVDTHPWNCPTVRRSRLLVHATPCANVQRVTLIAKRPIPKGYTVYDSIYITSVKWQNYRQNYRNGEQISGPWLRKWGGGRKVVIIMGGKDLYGDGNVLYHDCADVTVRAWYCAMDSQDVSIGRNWVKSPRALSLLVLLLRVILQLHQSKKFKY